MDSYRSWEDFLEPDDTQPVKKEFEESPPSIDDLFANPDVPGEVKQLLRRHQQLERQLKRVAGIPLAEDESTDPDAHRKELAYPVFVHSRETRIEQRRRRRAKERRMLFEKRRLEALRIERKRLLEAEAERHRARAERERRLREARHAMRRRRERARLERDREALEERLLQRQQEARRQVMHEQAIRRQQEQRLHEERLEAVRRRLCQERIDQRNEATSFEERRRQALRKLDAKRREFARFS